MEFEIDIVDGAMVLMDQAGNSHECVTLTGLRVAKHTIQTWAAR